MSAIKKRKRANIKFDKLPEFENLGEHLSQVESDDKALAEQVSEMVRLNKELTQFYDSIGGEQHEEEGMQQAGIMKKIQVHEKTLTEMMNQLMIPQDRPSLEKVFDCASRYHLHNLSFEKKLSDYLFEILTLLKELHGCLDPRVSKFQEAGFGIKNESLQEFLKELEIVEAMIQIKTENLGIHSDAIEPLESILKCFAEVKPHPTDNQLYLKFQTETMVFNLHAFCMNTIRVYRDLIYLLHTTMNQLNVLLFRIYDNHGSWPQIDKVNVSSKLHNIA